MHWIVLFLWNVSCWEDAGCEDKGCVEQPLLGQGHPRGLGGDPQAWGLLVLVLKGRLCWICASLGHRGWLVCGPLQESGAAKVQHSGSDALSCSASSLYSKPLFIYIWNIFTFCSEKQILHLLYFALANTMLVVLKYQLSLLNDKIFLDFNFHLLGFLCCSDTIKPLINFQAYVFAGEVKENLQLFEISLL